MSAAAAAALLDRVEQDRAFAEQLDQVKADNDAFVGVASDAGFDVTASEVRDAYLERHDELDAEQLDAIAAGSDGLIGLNFLVPFGP